MVYKQFTSSSKPVNSLLPCGAIVLHPSSLQYDNTYSII